MTLFPWPCTSNRLRSGNKISITSWHIGGSSLYQCIFTIINQNLKCTLWFQISNWKFRLFKLHLHIIWLQSSHDSDFISVARTHQPVSQFPLLSFLCLYLLPFIYIWSRSRNTLQSVHPQKQWMLNPNSHFMFSERNYEINPHCLCFLGS